MGCLCQNQTPFMAVDLPTLGRISLLSGSHDFFNGKGGHPKMIFDFQVVIFDPYTRQLSPEISDQRNMDTKFLKATFEYYRLLIAEDDKKTKTVHAF